MEFNETWQEARSQSPLPSLCFLGPDRKTRWPPWPLIGWDIFDFSSEPLNAGISTKLVRKQQITTSSTKFLFFGSIRKTRWPPWCLIGWDIFDFSSERAEWNSTKLDRKQGLNVLHQVCVFGPIRKQDGRPGLWLAETFFTSPLKPLKGIQRNLTGRKITTTSTKFVFFGPIGKTRWPPWSLIGWDIFDFSSETVEWNSTKLDRKQDHKVRYQVCVFQADRKTRCSPWPVIGWDIFNFSKTAEGNSTKLDSKVDHNVLYQVCVFRVDRKNKMAALVSDWLRHFRLLLWNGWMEFKETWQEARSQRPLPSLWFLGWSEKQDGRPGLWLAETFSTSPLKPRNGIQRNLTGSKISTFSTKFVFFRPISKQKCPPWPIPQKSVTLYSGARYVALWASCWCIYLGEGRGGVH